MDDFEFDFSNIDFPTDVILKLGSLEERKARFSPKGNVNQPPPRPSSQSRRKRKRRKSLNDIDTDNWALKIEFRRIKSECVAKLLLDLWRVPYYNIDFEVYMEWSIKMRPLLAKGLAVNFVWEEWDRMCKS